MQKKEWKEHKSNAVSSGHCKMVALISPQLLWLYAQDPHKIKLVNIPGWRVEGHVSPHLAEEMLTAVSHYGKESQFSLHYGSW